MLKRRRGAKNQCEYANVAHLHIVNHEVEILVLKYSKLVDSGSELPTKARKSSVLKVWMKQQWIWWQNNLHGCPRRWGGLPVGHSERGHRRVTESEHVQHKSNTNSGQGKINSDLKLTVEPLCGGWKEHFTWLITQVLKIGWTNLAY